jgi:FtsH-binding integral membrane protein
MIFNKENLLNKVKEALQSTVVMDEGLRAYMLKVYNYMASGIFLTGLVS